MDKYLICVVSRSTFEKATRQYLHRRKEIARGQFVYTKILDNRGNFRKYGDGRWRSQKYLQFQYSANINTLPELHLWKI